MYWTIIQKVIDALEDNNNYFKKMCNKIIDRDSIE